MKTVLKFPVYVEIETGNVDRAKVSSFARSVLYPHLIDYLAKAKYRTDVLTQLAQALKTEVSVLILTEVDLLRKAGISNTEISSNDVI